MSKAEPLFIVRRMNAYLDQNYAAGRGDLTDRQFRRMRSKARRDAKAARVALAQHN